MVEDFDEFASLAWGRMVRSGVLLGLSVQDAQDCAQEALARCFTAWPRVRAAEEPWAYAYTVFLNRVRSQGRRRRFTVVPVPQVADALPVAGAAPEESWAVLAAVRSLPPGQRAVIALRFYADLTERETAAVLDIPVGTVKSRTKRALLVLAAGELARDRGRDANGR